MTTYADALRSVKGGFLIIGLTGFTGSGCTTAARILRSKTKPVFPDYNSDFTRSPDSNDELRHKKLNRVWKEIDWEPFTPIDISKMIFTFAAYRALKNRAQKGAIGQIRQIIQPYRKELKYLHLLTDETEITKRNSSKLISAYEICSTLYIRFKRQYQYNLDDFILMMQNFGDQIRQFGHVFPSHNESPSPLNFPVLPEAIRRLIRSYRYQEKTRFVIDAFRNPYEVEFFKKRYSEFYLVCMLREKIERDIALKNLNTDFLTVLGNREKGGITGHEKENVHYWVTSQNIEECAQRADMFIDNQSTQKKDFPHLRAHLVKLLSLVFRRGCIPPSDDERAMQIAVTAKQMSGCISRQVGAVVVGKNGYVLGVGWNDTPEGQTPCSLRSAKQLISSPDPEIFSPYERGNEFVDHIRHNYNLDLPFCFKDEVAIAKQWKDKKAEYTRALHAEENAFLQITKNGGISVENSTLFTTASTCTLCAKKAYHLGVDRIVYIEEYPGLAVEQTLKGGSRTLRLDPFEGIVGSAFFKLFTPLAPEKDIISLLS